MEADRSDELYVGSYESQEGRSTMELKRADRGWSSGDGG